MPKTTNKIKTGAYRRTHRLAPVEGLDASLRTFPAAISSELTVKRWFGSERLVHTKKAINLEVARDGLPMLFNHNPDKPIGRADNVRLEGGILRADLHFSNNELANEVFRDVSENFLRDVSLGYSIETYKDVRGGIEATKWRPFEVSIATVPADHTVGINRSFKEGENMLDETRDLNDQGNNDQSGSGENQGQRDQSQGNILSGVNETRDLGITEGMRREQDRANSIRLVFSRFMDNEVAVETMNRCLGDYRISADQARGQLLEILSTGFVPTAQPSARTVETGEEEGDKFHAAAIEAVSVRTGIETDPKVISRVYSGELGAYGLKQLAIEYLKRGGISVAGDEMRVVGRALSMGQPQFRISGAHSSSDFPALLENVANKSMAKGYNSIEQTWRRWAGVGPVSDFKPTSFVTLSEFSDLELKPEGAEYKHGTYKDKKELLGLGTYGKMFSITRETIINDDLGALSRAPQGMGQAAGRSVEALVYTVFLSNPTLLEDSNTVWNANHNNVGTPGAIAEGTLDELRQLMASQKGVLNQAGKTKSKASTQLLNIPAKTLLVPKAMELKANKLMVAEYATDDLSNPNMMRGSFEVIASPYLDIDSVTAFYLMADAAQYDTVMVGFLNGNQSPYLESKNGWNVDGVEYKVRIDVGASWLDFRGTAKNVGA